MSETQVVKILRVFKSRIKSCKYHFKSGKEANFVDGKYYTDIKKEIEELEDEAANRHPHIYIDAEEKEISSDATDPISALKAKLRKDILAELAANSAKISAGNADLGATASPEQLATRLQGIVNSKQVAAAAAGSSSGANAPTAASKS